MSRSKLTPLFGLYHRTRDKLPSPHTPVQVVLRGKDHWPATLCHDDRNRCWYYPLLENGPTYETREVLKWASLPKDVWHENDRIEQEDEEIENRGRLHKKNRRDPV